MSLIFDVQISGSPFPAVIPSAPVRTVEKPVTAEKKLSDEILNFRIQRTMIVVHMLHIRY